MTDIFSPAKRSQVMSCIRGKGNSSTELRMIALFRKNHVTGWRRGAALPGKPDFVFRKAKVAVFVDGCFWHRCPLHYTAPATRAGFWDAKTLANKRRDRSVSRELRAAGWTVLRVWEHAIRAAGAVKTIGRIRRSLTAAAGNQAN